MTTLRTATLADIPAIRQLILDSVRGLSVSEYSSAQIESALTHIFGVDTQLVADGTYYVMLDGEVVVAAGGWSARQTLYGGDQHKGETDLTIDPATSPARIRAFFLHPAWARRGLARQIFAACEAAAAASRFRRFELMATLPGVPLYRALGFADLESVSVPLPGGFTLPCIRMDRPIDAKAAHAHQISPTVNPSGKGSSGSTT
jgi:GNAT superfamily N-acetyltransferase